MGEFERVFQFERNGQTEENFLDMNQSLASLPQTIREDLDRRRLSFKKQPSSGSFSYVFRSESIPGAVIRIGNMDTPPRSAIMLKSAAHFIYALPNDPSTQCQVHILPYAPDKGDVAETDIINTMRVLKTEGLLDRLSDVHYKQFVYLDRPDGKRIRYPDNVADPEMRGKPIAFIRDLNCLHKELSEANVFSQMSQERLLTRHGLTLPDLKIVSHSCIQACHQQDELAKNIRYDLKSGIANLRNPNLHGPKSGGGSWIDKTSQSFGSHDGMQH